MLKRSCLFISMLLAAFAAVPAFAADGHYPGYEGGPNGVTGPGSPTGHSWAAPKWGRQPLEPADVALASDADDSPEWEPPFGYGEGTRGENKRDPYGPRDELEWEHGWRGR